VPECVEIAADHHPVFVSELVALVVGPSKRGIDLFTHMTHTTHDERHTQRKREPLVRQLNSAPMNARGGVPEGA
jgi:hypothetical protein